MLSLYAIDHTEDFLKENNDLLDSANSAHKYNYSVALIKKQQTLSRSDIKYFFIPNRVLFLNFMSYYARYLFISILVLTSCIPFLNILSCLILLLLCMIYIWTLVVIRNNEKLKKNAFDSMIQYNDLCIDSNGNQLLSRCFMIDLQIFARESIDMQGLIKEAFGARDQDEQVFILFYHNLVREWFDKQQVVDNTLVFCLIFGFCFALIITSVVNFYVVKNFN